MNSENTEAASKHVFIKEKQIARNQDFGSKLVMGCIYSLTMVAISWISGVPGLGSIKPPANIFADCFFSGQEAGAEVVR